MRKFKFVNDNTYSDYHITLNKVYDLVKYLPSDVDSIFDCIIIINDRGYECDFYIKTNFGNVIFQEVTAEYRNVKIDEILN